MTRSWSTSATATAGQFACWRELICEAFLALSPESDLRDGFAGRVTQWPLGRLDLARIDSQRQRVRRTEHDIARAPRPGYYANLQVRGSSLVAQHGRQTVLGPGDLAVVATGEPFTMDFRADFQQLTLFVPGALLDAPTHGRVPTAVRVDTGAGVGAAIRHTLTTLTRTSWEPGLAARLATHAAGLLAVAVQHADPASRDHAGSARSRGRPGSARSRAAAVADIEEHLTDEDLSPAATARRLGISVRTLHALFAGDDLSFRRHGTAVPAGAGPPGAGGSGAGPPAGHRHRRGRRFRERGRLPPRVPARVRPHSGRDPPGLTGRFPASRPGLLVRPGPASWPGPA